MKVFLLIIHLMLTQLSFAEDLKALKYNQKNSLTKNEANFINAMKQDCKSRGYIYGQGDMTVRDVMETYPKSLVFMFMKKNLDQFCYYAISNMTKYLASEFKEQTEELIVIITKQCFVEDMLDKPKMCRSFNEKAVLFDLTILLGSFCSKKSFNLLQKIYCHFKKLGDKQCRLFKDHGKPLNKCPFYFTNQQESLNLHKSYYNNECKRPKWIKPSCLK